LFKFGTAKIQINYGNTYDISIFNISLTIEITPRQVAREGTCYGFPTAKVVIKIETAKGSGGFNIKLTINPHVIKTLGHGDIKNEKVNPLRMIFP
jgi:hypothetical protein